MIKFNDAFELNEEQLKELSALHGKMHRTQICDVGYLFRRAYTVDWKKVEDYRLANPNATQEILDEKLVDICLIGPKPDIMAGGWANTEAGVLPNLAMLIKAKSGFVVPDFQNDQLINVDDLDEATIPEKPTTEELEKLKAANKFKLKGVRLEEIYVVIRPLTRIEWKAIQKANPEDADKVLCEKAVLWPAKIDWDTDYPVGYTDTLSNVILNMSGFTRPQNIEDL